MDGGRDLVKETRQAVETLMAEKGWKRHQDVAKYLGINSANIYYLMQHNTLRPALWHAAVAHGLVRPLTPTVKLAASTIAVIMSQARFAKPKPKTKRKPRAPRLSIQKENPKLAAQAIKKHLTPDNIEELIKELACSAKETEEQTD